MVTRINCVICTVPEHIVAKEALAGGSVAVGIDESAQRWIVVSGSEVVEAGFSRMILPVSPKMVVWRLYIRDRATDVFRS